MLLVIVLPEWVIFDSELLRGVFVSRRYKNESRKMGRGLVWTIVLEIPSHCENSSQRGIDVGILMD